MRLKTYKRKKNKKSAILAKFLRLYIKLYVQMYNLYILVIFSKYERTISNVIVAMFNMVIYDKDL